MGSDSSRRHDAADVAERTGRKQERQPDDVPGPGGPDLRWPAWPHDFGGRVAGALGLQGFGTSPDHPFLPIGDATSDRPTQACGPRLLVAVIPRRTSFTVGPSTSLTPPGTVGGR